MGDLTPRELLFQVREMADPNGSQIFDNDVARLRGIVTYIEGNLVVEESDDADDDYASTPHPSAYYDHPFDGVEPGLGRVTYFDSDDE